VKTEELITKLAAGAESAVIPVDRTLIRAVAVGCALSTALFLGTMHFRPDIALAFQTPRFLLKLVVSVSLAVTAAMLLPDIARPLPHFRHLRSLAVAPALLAVGVLFELYWMPMNTWAAQLMGRNASNCLLLIPLLSLPAAVSLLIALRRGAPAHPARAGAIAGIVSGGIGAALYALLCPNDSPLFVATWYSIAIAAVATLCAGLGRRALRW
jgi:hypothetical protein